MKTILPYLEFFHNFVLSVLTFVEFYPLSTIKIIKEDVRFRILFRKCTMACFTNFYKNRSTSIVSNLDFIFCSFLPMFFGFSNFIDFYGQSISRFLKLLFVCFFQIIRAPFFDKAENRELPNSCTVVEVGLNEIPLTLGFNFQMFQVEDMELPNSRAIVAISLDEIPSTLNVDSKVPHLPMVEVSPFHVIFNLNKILITTCFNKGFHIVIFRFGLKEFMGKCLLQFQIYICSTTQCHKYI